MYYAPEIDSPQSNEKFEEEHIMNLFIIGNGFDIAHGIKSSYKYFKEYINEYETDIFVENNTELSFCCRNIGLNEYHGVEGEDGLNVVEMAINEASPDAEWSQFENTLGELDFESVIEYGDEEEINEWTKEDNERKIQALLKSVENMKKVFARWVEQLDTQKNMKVDFKRLIKEDDFVLNFNYTDTIENIYGVKSNVLHIHGRKGEPIIVGHGIDIKNFGYLNYFVNGDGLIELKVGLRKNVEDILKEKRTIEFLNKIEKANVEKVFSYGFSYGDVDMPYMKEICKHLGNKAIWSFNNYDSEEKISVFEDKLRKAGFSGSFDRFEVKK
jgi:hypothetical protein